MHFRGRGVEILGTLFTCFIVAAGGTPCNALYISSQRRGRQANRWDRREANAPLPRPKYALVQKRFRIAAEITAPGMNCYGLAVAPTCP